MTAGVRTTDFTAATTVDALLGNREGETVQITIDRLIALLAALMGPTYGTRAALYADLAWPAGAIGYVRADGTPAFNGVYKKAGASGAGSWSRIGDLPSGAVEASQLLALEAAMPLKANSASPTFTGVPIAPTPAPGTNTAQVATAAFVQAAIAALLAAAPGALDTLNELATALGNDPNFATTMTNALSTLSAKTAAALGTTAGSSTAYTATSDRNLVSGMRLTVTFHLSNTGSGPTIAITQPNAVVVTPTLRTAQNVNLQAGEVRAGLVYDCLFLGTTLQVLGVMRGAVAETPFSLRAMSTAASAYRDMLAPGPSKSTDEDAVTLDHTRPYWLSPETNGRVVRATVPGAWVMAEHAAVGSSRITTVDVANTGGATVNLYCGINGSWRGTSSKIIRFSTGANIEIIRVAQNEYIAVDRRGSTPVDVAGNPPLANYTILWVGQSNARRFPLGLYGFQEMMRLLGVTATFWFVSAGVQAAAIAEGYASDVNNYFWRQSNDTPGPNGTAAQAAWQAANAIGQPLPNLIWLWCFETESNYLAATTTVGPPPTLSISDAYHARKDFIAWMRAQIGNAFLPVIVVPIGRKDGIVGATDAQHTAARWVDILLDAHDANIHLGPSVIDVSQPWDDVHPDYKGQMVVCARLAMQTANILAGGTNNLGPTTEAIAELDSGLRYEVSIAQGAFTIDRPTADLQGFAILPAGTDPITGTPVPIAPNGFAWSFSAPYHKLTITLEYASPGATVVYPYGRGGAESGVSDFVNGRVPRQVAAWPAGTTIPNYLPLRPFAARAGMIPPAAP
jgi:hypothetical protein